MMKPGKFFLKCPVCSAAYESGSGAFTCVKCNAPTVVALNLGETSTFQPTNEASMWRYFDMLPLEDKRCAVSQGEGWTPLVESPRLASDIGVNKVFLKNETVNPTGSFKDRQISVGISKAKEKGADTVAVVSSGNVAAAAASYAAIAGMKCNIFAPANAPDEKLIQARVYGASFLRVNTLSSSRIFELVIAACKRNRWHLLSTAGLYNPFQVEGAKTIAYELFEQTGTLPDWIVVPVGGGGLLGALWRGFTDLKTLGKCSKIPALVGVQSSACTPLIKAIEDNLSPAQAIANPVSVGDTIAGAIADDILFDAYTALPAVRNTGGRAVSVSDEEMLEAEKTLAGAAGIFAEPASASTIAALKKLCDAGAVAENHTVCCVITGSGFKDMASARRLVGASSSIEPSEEAFLRLG